MPYAHSYGGGGEDFNCGAGEGTSGGLRGVVPTQNDMIVPTLCVGMQPGTLRVPCRRDAERPLRHSHAERGNDR
ncbi:conserved hypothetical protein [Pseudomonas sp. IT-P2]